MICLFGIVSPTNAGKGGGGKPGGSGDTGPSYEIVELDDESQGLAFASTQAEDLNDNQVVVGFVDNSLAGGQFACYWTADNQLAILPGDGTVARAINNLNQVVGYSEEDQVVGYGDGTYTRTIRTALYWPGLEEEPSVLLPLPGDDGSAAFGINEQGIICGQSTRAVYGVPYQGHPNYPNQTLLKTEYHPVVWKVPADGVARPFELPHLGDIDPSTTDLADTFGNASALNSEVAGTSTVVGTFKSIPGLSENTSADGKNIAAVSWQVSFVQSEDGIQLAATATTIEYGDYIRASSVNELDEVVGQLYEPVSSSTFPMYWSPLTSGVLDGLPNGSASDINSAGSIVGQSYYESRRTQAVYATLWPSPDSSPIQLDRFRSKNSNLSLLKDAHAINLNGAIVGRDSGGRAFLAVPK